MVEFVRRLFCRLLAAFLAAGIGLALAACSKCDVPTWRHNPAPGACHDSGAVK
jgi:hypothetical protein